MIVQGVRYLRRELEHRSADDERSWMMLGSQSQCVCAVNRPQTPVSQNRLCADDHLNNAFIELIESCVWLTCNNVLQHIAFPVHLVDSWHHSENGRVWDDRCLNVLFAKTCGHFMPLMDKSLVKLLWRTSIYNTTFYTCFKTNIKSNYSNSHIKIVLIINAIENYLDNTT